MSDTPIMDAVDAKCDELNVMDAICYAVYEGQKLEEKLNEANDRIKQLEDAGDALYANCDPSRWDSAATAARKLSDQNAWREAKEAKL